MRRAGLIIISTVLVVVSLIVAVGLLPGQSGQAIQIRLGPIALTPETAVRTMLTNRGIIADFQVVEKHSTATGMLVVYTYTRQHKAVGRQAEFGYALVRLRWGGWSVMSANIEQVAPSEEVSYATAQIGHDLLIYGYALRPSVTAVEATLDTGGVIARDVAERGFSIIGAQARALHELRTREASPSGGTRFTQPAVVRPHTDER